MKPAEPNSLRGLDANLDMQSSAEYRACSPQAFALADHQVGAKLAARGACGKGRPSSSTWTSR